MDHLVPSTKDQLEVVGIRTAVGGIDIVLVRIARDHRPLYELGRVVEAYSDPSGMIAAYGPLIVIQEPWWVMGGDL